MVVRRRTESCWLLKLTPNLLVHFSHTILMSFHCSFTHALRSMKIVTTAGNARSNIARRAHEFEKRFVDQTWWITNLILILKVKSVAAWTPSEKFSIKMLAWRSFKRRLMRMFNLCSCNYSCVCSAISWSLTHGLKGNRETDFSSSPVYVIHDQIYLEITAPTTRIISEWNFPFFHHSADWYHDAARKIATQTQESLTIAKGVDTQYTRHTIKRLWRSLPFYRDLLAVVLHNTSVLPAI